MEVAPSEWIPILKKSYQRLRQMGVGDLVVYGSQSLSLFLQTPLSSKNVDLAGSATLEHVVDLAKHLSPEERFEVRRVGRGYVYVVYAKTSAQRPIAVEIFTHTPWERRLRYLTVWKRLRGGARLSGQSLLKHTSLASSLPHIL